MKKLYLILATSIIVILYACQGVVESDVATPFQLRLSFKPKVGAQDLVFNTNYTNPFGEIFNVNSFKYYITNIKLKDAATGVFIPIPNSYHLINHAEPASQAITLKLSSNAFSAVSFLLGVDSARNFSGVQTGDLDPVKGMFWTWNTGYIQAKLEGVSPQSTAPNNYLTYHIGGYKAGENTIRPITLTFPLNNQVAIKNGGTSEVIINADVNTWFSGVHDIRIANHAVAMNPGTLAVQIADNYANMFSVAAVNN
jgi:hypothetical protein